MNTLQRQVLKEHWPAVLDATHYSSAVVHFQRVSLISCTEKQTIERTVGNESDDARAVAMWKLIMTKDDAWKTILNYFRETNRQQLAVLLSRNLEKLEGEIYFFPRLISVFICKKLSAGCPAHGLS